MPSSQFLNLAAEKQQTILQSSLNEFAEYGYDAASTNRIVQRAGISKGVLFKYFKDKEALFTYVCDNSIQGYFVGLPREPEQDLFEYIRKITIYKLRFLRENPLTYQLLVRIMKDPQHPVHAKIMESQAALIQQFTEDLKTILSAENLRSGLTWKHVMDFITWVGYALQEKYINAIPDVVDDKLEESFQPMIDELDVYLDILRFGIYKEVQSR